MSEHHITYALTAHQPPIDSAEVPDGHGACDALLLAVIGLDENKDSTTRFHTINGVTGQPLDAGEQFKIWYLLARDLSQLLQPGTGRQEMCTMVADKISEAYQAAKGAANEQSTSNSN